MWFVTSVVVHYNNYVPSGDVHVVKKKDQKLEDEFLPAIWDDFEKEVNSQVIAANDSYDGSALEGFFLKREFNVAIGPGLFLDAAPERKRSLVQVINDTVWSSCVKSKYELSLEK